MRSWLTLATLILAPLSITGGTISFAGGYRSYGNIVIIEHGKGWNSLITSLDSVEFTKGQKIDQGALLGRAGKKDLKLALNCAKMAA